jgi:Peptidase propeptide and YPEB domain
MKMHRSILASVTFLSLALLAIPARADRPVTDAERVKLEAAVQTQTCSGGKMEFDEDDRQFEVDDVVCNDGHKYDLKFDTEFKFIRKHLD